MITYEAILWFTAYAIGSAAVVIAFTALRLVLASKSKSEAVLNHSAEVLAVSQRAVDNSIEALKRATAALAAVEELKSTGVIPFDIPKKDD
jgi:hypothetical protein